MQQLNSTVYPGEDSRKFEVGQRLRFVRHSPDESIHSELFQPGDLLTVMERNGCGLGIDARRDDGTPDMVFPEEVELA